MRKTGFFRIARWTLGRKDSTVFSAVEKSCAEVVNLKTRPASERLVLLPVSLETVGFKLVASDLPFFGGFEIVSARRLDMFKKGFLEFFLFRKMCFSKCSIYGSMELCLHFFFLLHF